MSAGAAALPTRAARQAALTEREFDVVVIGGGITGVGTALDLSMRGLQVALLERDDWASATSSASSRLVHGGLRYLEQFELGLVRESCLERALLLRNAAGLVWPESFVFPVRRGDRIGRWKMAAGLWLYTLLSMPRALGLPRLLSAADVAARLPGIDRDALTGGGAYLDGATDDARLTLAVLLTASEEGVVALSRAEVRSVKRTSVEWQSGVKVGFTDRLSGARHTLRARRAVLAGGPFTEALRGTARLSGTWISPTRGSHLMVPRDRLPTSGAAILSSPIDGRVMFLIPWPRYTVVGTTDLDASVDEPIAATRAEVDYLLESANGLVPEARLTHADVVSTWAGLRPLLASSSTNPSARSREERVAVEGPVYTIAGGKLTGYRAMAEKLGARIARDLAMGNSSRRSPTRTRRLVGALDERAARPTWSETPGSVGPDDALGIAWAHRYGARQSAVEAMCQTTADGTRQLDAETLLGEVDWAVREEDCLSPADFAFRRTDLARGPAGADPETTQLLLDRMESLLGWSAADRAQAAAELAEALGRTCAWRDEG